MMIYDNEFETNDYILIGGLVSTQSVLGICLNLEDERILELIDNPELLSQCLKEVIPQIKFREAHRVFYEMADHNGVLMGGSYWRQWEEYISELGYATLTTMKGMAEMILGQADSCQQRSVNNAITFLECLNSNFPERYVRNTTPEEKAKASFDRKKPKIRVKLVIRDGYKCSYCDQNKEDSLCIVKKDRELDSYELDNLIFSCRRCINLNKAK